MAHYRAQWSVVKIRAWGSQIGRRRRWWRHELVRARQLLFFVRGISVVLMRQMEEWRQFVVAGGGGERVEDEGTAALENKGKKGRMNRLVGDVLNRPLTETLDS